ncbi:MAG: agmatine deiminase family protein [Chitinophagaceae bacterium]|nr:agmatine deiminase family protein [Chitinophagaceae bacterium]
MEKTITDASAVCGLLGISYIDTDIVLDGGNLICSGKDKNAIIFCDKIFKENPRYTEKELIAELERLLETDKLIFIPTDPYDVYGHADGLVRFLNEDSVLINQYRMKDGDFHWRLRTVLKNAGLDYIEIPCKMANNTHYHQANGCYINYLQMKDLILLPVFGLKEDEEAVEQFESLFKSHRIVSLESNEIAHEGGVLNCVSWGVKNCRLPCKVKP